MPRPGWSCRRLSRRGRKPGASANAATAHRGPGPNPVHVMERLPLSRELNPATGKTPIDLNEIRIRPSETSSQFIS